MSMPGKMRTRFIAPLLFLVFCHVAVGIADTAAGLSTNHDDSPGVTSQQQESLDDITQQGEPPVCTNSNDAMCGSSQREFPSSDVVNLDVLAGNGDATACSLLFLDTFVVSGRIVPRGGALQGTSDVMISFRLHERVFPIWNRFYYFWQQPPQIQDVVFVPGLGPPMECHSRFANVEVPTDPFGILSWDSDEPLRRNDALVANRPLAIGDPVFLPCRHSDLSSEYHYENITHYFSVRDMLHSSQSIGCINVLDLKETPMAPDGFATVALHAFAPGDVITKGVMIHLHRHEILDQVTNVSERILNYCYGHPHSDLLLLPYLAFATTIQAASDTKPANAQWGWFGNDTVEDIFDQPLMIMFAQTEKSLVQVKLEALSKIEIGDEIVVDFGPRWKQAWYDFQLAKDGTLFRHERGLPEDFFPSQWLAQENRRSMERQAAIKADKEQEGNGPQNTSERLVLDRQKLSVGEVKPIRLTTGEILSKDGLFRVGLPEGLADKLESWAMEMGITELMRDYVTGNMILPHDSYERQRILGGTWWVKRFWKEWASDMHYISPDDDESDQQFMNALSEGGFDRVLQAVGEFFALKSLTCFYASYIAVSHTTFSFMHSDSTIFGAFNLIFPVLQVEGSEPELTLGPDNLSYHVPYKYERDHACLLHVHGQHGTAPCDYRGTDSIRMVVSVYFADFTDKQRLKVVMKEWFGNDPPYPRTQNMVQHLTSRQHWSATDPNRTLKTPFG